MPLVQSVQIRVLCVSGANVYASRRPNPNLHRLHGPCIALHLYWRSHDSAPLLENKWGSLFGLILTLKMNLGSPLRMGG